MASEKRRKRLASLIREEVAEIVSREIPIEGNALITVTRAEVSPDGAHANVSVSVYPPKNAQETLRALTNTLWHIQQALNQRLRMRPVPKIRFIIDRSGQQATEIDGLLKRVAEQ